MRYSGALRWCITPVHYETSYPNPKPNLNSNHNHNPNPNPNHNNNVGVALGTNHRWLVVAWAVIGWQRGVA